MVEKVRNGVSLERAAPSIPHDMRVAVDSDKIGRLRAIFEEKAVEFGGVEVWLARDLQPLLDYAEWRNFLHVIAKAKMACEQAGASPEDHFVEVNKMIEKGKGAKEEISDIALTRYACYLIAQNGDPSKAPVAFAQTYFALQTRKLEVLESRLAERERLVAREKLTQTEKELSGELYQRGVDDKGFGIIRSKGDAALFGGASTSDMKSKLGVPTGRALADFLPTVTIKAKDLAAAITKHIVQTSDIRGHEPIGRKHMETNRNVRKALTDSAIFPEYLPPAEDIKKVERRLKSEERTLPRASACIPKPEED
jgi:DNA-damage-inducible protein D